MSNHASKLPRFIAVTGREASGKDSYGEHLSKKGYLHVSAGDVLRERARSLGHTGPFTRAILTVVGDEMKKEFGPSPVTESALRKYELAKTEFPSGLVISGHRRVGELSAFKERGAIVLWIDASEERRLKNQFSRGRDDKQAKEEFLERSKREYFGNTEGGKNGVNLRAIEALADYKVANDGSLEKLLSAADQALEQSMVTEQIFQVAAKGLIRNDNGGICMVHIPKWEHNPAHWDLPGGRVNTGGETFLETLNRELKEELGVGYVGKPKQLMGMLTNITIPVGDDLLPLIFMLYSVKVADTSKIKLAEDTREDKLKWFSPKEAAKNMSFKFSPEFCELVSKL